MIKNKFKFDKYVLNKAEGILSQKLINEIKLKINSEIKNLTKDYNKKKIQKALFKETFSSRALSYRVFDDKLVKKILNRINFFIKNNVSSKTKKRFIINPLIYIRYCRPKEPNIKNYKMAEYYTEPHYDRSFQNKSFYSIWIPLEETSKKTGTLCYFDIPKKLRLHDFPINKKNKYSFYNYFENPIPADNLLKKYKNSVYTKKGDVIFFNNYCLHGATKPVNKTRFSLNFQVFDSNIVKSQDKFEKRKFLLSSISMDLTNLLNLISIGDYKGAKRFLKKGKTELYKKIAKKFEIDIDFKNLKILNVRNFPHREMRNTNFLKNFDKNIHYKQEISFFREENYI